MIMRIEFTVYGDELLNQLRVKMLNTFQMLPAVADSEGQEYTCHIHVDRGLLPLVLNFLIDQWEASYGMDQAGVANAFRVSVYS